MFGLLGGKSKQFFFTRGKSKKKIYRGENRKWPILQGVKTYITGIFFFKCIGKNSTPLIATNIYVVVKYMSNGSNITFTYRQINIYLWTIYNWQQKRHLWQILSIGTIFFLFFKLGLMVLYPCNISHFGFSPVNKKNLQEKKLKMIYITGG